MSFCLNKLYDASALLAQDLRDEWQEFKVVILRNTHFSVRIFAPFPNFPAKLPLVRGHKRGLR